ncbi:MAG TPA: hypothetical protein VK742_06520 [Candidatus Sulfotelmatobacter sp.]|jgi:hypothetical protein|nr:hypothetical protein [Candidatus Sulfotelmatobacter sp.]
MLKKTLTKCVALAGVLYATSYTSVQAQPIYTNTFNNPMEQTNWVVNFSYYGVSGTNFDIISNNLAVFNFDYTTMGIPLAPHSVEFGSDAIHHGLKLVACYTNTAALKGSAATAGLSASPTNFSITANFTMHADMWINVDCTPYAVANSNNVTGGSFVDNVNDGGAETVLYGCGYGTAGTTATTPGLTDAIFGSVLSDNGTTSDIRMYGPEITPIDAQISYQDGVYPSTGTTTAGYGGESFVYNNINGLAHDTGGNGPGGRNILSSTGSPPYTSAQMGNNIATGKSWASIFPPEPVPLAQQIAWPRQTNNYCLPGFFDFAWHDVEVDKIGNVIVFKMDGNTLATGNYATAGAPAGSYLTFLATRTASGVASMSTATYYTNLNFVVFANIVVSNFNSIVNVTATTPTCQEGVPGTPAVFDINRPSSGVPLTVFYTLTGTATNGSQYTLVSTNVTFASTATDTNIYIYPIDDGIPSATRTVVLTLLNGTNYVAAGNAVANILDGDTPTVSISGTSQAYGRYTNTTFPFGGGNNCDFMTFMANRLGKLTLGSNLVVNLSYGGTAVAGTDFLPTSNVTIMDGFPTSSITIFPVDDTAISSNVTVTVSAAPGAGLGYAVGSGSGTGTVVSAHYPAATVLFSDDLQSAGDSIHWGVTYGTSDEVDDPANYNAEFGTSLSSAPGGITVPSPPGGNANALFLQCNRNNSTSPSPGGVNLYYTNQVLNGNFAVRFNMNLIESDVLTGSGADATEGAMFGINHTGTCSNWWYGGGFTTNLTWSSDGVFYYVSACPASAGVGSDYSEFTGAGGTNGNFGWANLAGKTQSSFTAAFKDGPPLYGPFTCFDANGNQTPGQAANWTPIEGYDCSTWSDVEMQQLGDGLGHLVDSMYINHTLVFSYTNTTVWTNGYLMLGYEDPYGASIGSAESGVYYANLQVVQLPSTVPISVTINSIKITGGNVVITFTTTSPADTTSSFTLEGSSTLSGTYTGYSAVGSTTITSLGSNKFQASTPYTAAGSEFYLIQHN